MTDPYEPAGTRGIRDFKRPKDWTKGDDERPKWAIVREVDLRGSDVKLIVEFSKGKLEKVETEFSRQRLFRKIGLGTYNFPDATPLQMKRDFHSPLSLHNDRLAYVIYILNKKNWQFSHDQTPFTISPEAYKKDAYFEAAHIRPDGALKGTPGSGVHAAYLIADKDAAYEQAKQGFVDQVNLHVDLIFEDSRDDDSFMPLIIDPDIRYPGGSA